MLMGTRCHKPALNYKIRREGNKRKTILLISNQREYIDLTREQVLY